MNYDPYPIRFKPDERAMLKELASRLGMSQTKTIRALVRGTLEVLREEEERNKESVLHTEPA
jgi:hypothetical protein